MNYKKLLMNRYEFKGHVKRIVNLLSFSWVANDGKVKNDSLNPFEAIIETPKHPMARILRENVWKGIKDTYRVLAGHHYNTEKGRKGVLDLLGFPLLARRLLYISNKEKLHLAIRISTRVVGGFLELVRQAVAVSLTIALIPVVALVHLALAPFAFYYRKKAGELKVTETNKYGVGTTEKTLSQLLTEKDLSLSKIYPDRDRPTEIFDAFSEVISERNVYVSKDNSTKFFPTIPSDNDKAQQEALDAFTTLNIGGKRG